MTFDELKKRACYNRPEPDGLTDHERLQFIIARRVYAGFRYGEISREEGKTVLEFAEKYTRLPAKERLALLRYGFALLHDDAGRGITGAAADADFITKINQAENLKGVLTEC